MTRLLPVLVTALALLTGGSARAAGPQTAPSPPAPVLVGLDAEFGVKNSLSAESIQRGILTAMDEINRAGGVLGGRPLRLEIKEHHAIAARGIRNIREFAAMPDVVAVFGGRFSPVVIEELPALRETRTLLLAPWSSADPIIDNHMEPNYIFRLSLRDSLAMPFMLRQAKARGLSKVGLLLTNTGWGRSNLAAAEAYFKSNQTPEFAGAAWYNWQDKSLLAPYQTLVKRGAEAIVLVANDDEAAALVREVADLPRDRQVPILSHWGVTGGDFAAQAGSALARVDFSVIQTFSLFRADPGRLAGLLEITGRLFGVTRVEEIRAPVGFAHAYDLTHILARAIDLAGTTDRPSVRDALERVENYQGLIKDYAKPFGPASHEALGPADLLMARYRDDGALVPVDVPDEIKTR